MGAKKDEYNRAVRQEHFMKKEEELRRQCTFQPKINPATQISHYTYQVSTEDGTVELEADVIKRNQFWAQTKQKRLEKMKREKENQIKEECTFTPKTSNGMSPPVNPL